jgi:hypothetical protein
VIVENKPAAGGMLATRDVLGQPKDGYTLLLCTHFESINTVVYRNPQYDIRAEHRHAGEREQEAPGCVQHRLSPRQGSAQANSASLAFYNCADRMDVIARLGRAIQYYRSVFSGSPGQAGR